MRYFFESAKTQNFAATAKKFVVPASSVSASVKRLEKELETQLFDRSHNKITLNEKGFILAETLGELFEKLDRTVSEISEKSEESKQICILVRARRKWITELIIKYKEQFPNIHFKVSHDSTITDFGAFDIIVDEQSEKYNDLSRFLLSVEQICVKASKNNPLVGKELSFGQLRNQPFLMGQKGNNMWKLLQETAKRNNFIPNVVIESNDRQCLLRCADAGMGLILGSRRALQDELEKNLIALNLSDFDEIQSVYAYHRRTIDNTVKHFLGFLKENCNI